MTRCGLVLAISALQRYLSLSILCLVLVCSSLACTPKHVGPTASGYFFGMLTAPTAYRGESTALVVAVQDAQGRPVDGVLVEFEIEPAWTGSASVSPARVLTSRGKAQTVFQAGVIGVVRVTVRVDGSTETIRMAVSLRGTPSTSASGRPHVRLVCRLTSIATPSLNPTSPLHSQRVMPL
jgi:hypothetical protein